YRARRWARGVRRSKMRRTRKRPKELVGGPRVVSHRLRTSPESLRSARDPRSPALRPSNPAPGTAPWITPRSGLAVRTCPFGQDEMYRRGAIGHNGLIHEVAAKRGGLIPEFHTDVDEMWMATAATLMQHPRHPAGRRFRWEVGRWLGSWLAWSPCTTDVANPSAHSKHRRLWGY